MRWKLGVILILLISVSLAKGQEKQGNIHIVWDNNRPFPLQENIPFLAGAVDVIVHRAGSDSYNFLHDAVIVEHKNILYAA